MKTNKRVQVVANRNKYTKHPFMAVPHYDDRINAFITGQHIIPGVTKENEGLTTDEMIGEVPLSEEKAKRFPFVINPDNQIPIIHLSFLDLSTNEKGQVINPKDKALYDFYMLQTDIVAPSKDKFITDRHFFYIKDAQLEAEQRVSKVKSVFNAQQKVLMNTSIRKLSDLALMLTYSIKDFSVNVDILTTTQLEDHILQLCEKHPQKVIDCYADGSEERLFVIKLITKNIIVKREDAFYDGQVFLGRQISEIIDYMKKPQHEGYLDKWQKLLEGNKDVQNSQANESAKRDKYNDLITESFDAIFDENLKKATELFNQAKLLFPNGDKNAKIQERITALTKRLATPPAQVQKPVKQPVDNGQGSADMTNVLDGKTFEQLQNMCKNKKWPKVEWELLTDKDIRLYILGKLSISQVANKEKVFE